MMPLRHLPLPEDQPFPGILEQEAESALTLQLIDEMPPLHEQVETNTATQQHPVDVITDGQTKLFEKPEDLLDLDALARVIATRRKEVGPHKARAGGAFGGALKRRIVRTDSVASKAATTEGDIRGLSVENLSYQLFSVPGDFVFHGVVFTPEEYKSITKSPEELANRVEADVMSGTRGRDASSRQARSREVMLDALSQRQHRAVSLLARLSTQGNLLEALHKEIQSPGFSHMSRSQMDSLMRSAEGTFLDMFEAIAANRGVGTERVASLQPALDYLLTRSDKPHDYREAFKYWSDMTSLGCSWVALKGVRIANMRDRIDAEHERRTAVPVPA